MAKEKSQSVTVDVKKLVSESKDKKCDVAWREAHKDNKPPCSLDEWRKVWRNVVLASKLKEEAAKKLKSESISQKQHDEIVEDIDKHNK